MSAHEKKEMKLAIMLMIVVVVFLICNILALIVNILELFGIDINEVTETSNLLVTINSSVNFFIYIIFGEKFKKQLCQCFEEISCFKRLSVLWNRYLSLYIVYSCMLVVVVYFHQFPFQSDYQPFKHCDYDDLVLSSNLDTFSAVRRTNSFITISHSNQRRFSIKTK